jgi:hypothetical protein
MANGTDVPASIMEDILAEVLNRITGHGRPWTRILQSFRP